MDLRQSPGHQLPAGSSAGKLTGHRLPLLSALGISIPAFYLVLAGRGPFQLQTGSILYGVTAVLMAFHMLRDHGSDSRRTRAGHGLPSTWLDLAILLGALASAIPTATPWPVFEWWLRLGFSGIVFVRLALVVVGWAAPHRLTQLLLMAAVLLGFAGGGFYWLEPQVTSYGDGLWLAFITGATVGYGDLVPTVPASRIFAVFIVLLGFAVFSVVTASISALFVGEDEKALERKMHADIQHLRREITELRQEIKQLADARAKNSAG